MNKNLLGKILGGVLQKLADSEPTTTTAGAILSLVIAAQIDWVKLLQGDENQIVNAVGVLAVLVLGYYTNHKKFKA